MVDPTGALLVVALNRLLLTGVEIVLLGVVAALRRGHVVSPAHRAAEVPSPTLLGGNT